MCMFTYIYILERERDRELIVLPSNLECVYFDEWLLKLWDTPRFEWLLHVFTHKSEMKW
jgi:hypothetical protein